MQEFLLVAWAAAAVPATVLVALMSVSAGYEALRCQKSDVTRARGKAQAFLVLFFVGVPLALLWPLTFVFAMIFVLLRIVRIATVDTYKPAIGNKPKVNHCYTPTEDEIRELWVNAKRDGHPTDREGRSAEFDRWLGGALAEHENWAVQASRVEPNLDGIKVELVTDKELGSDGQTQHDKA